MSSNINGNRSNRSSRSNNNSTPGGGFSSGRLSSGRLSSDRLSSGRLSSGGRIPKKIISPEAVERRGILYFVDTAAYNLSLADLAVAELIKAYLSTLASYEQEKTLNSIVSREMQLIPATTATTATTATSATPTTATTPTTSPTHPTSGCVESDVAGTAASWSTVIWPTSSRPTSSWLTPDGNLITVRFMGIPKTKWMEIQGSALATLIDAAREDALKSAVMEAHCGRGHYDQRHYDEIEKRAPRSAGRSYGRALRFMKEGVLDDLDGKMYVSYMPVEMAEFITDCWIAVRSRNAMR